MAITDHSDDIQAYITDQARELIARVTIGQVVWNAVGFSVGRGGYNPVDPVHIVPVTTSDMALMDQVYPDVTGYSPYAMIEAPTDTTRVYDCRLPATLTPTNADYGLGELALWGQIISSNVPAEVGTVFMFALAHMPIRAKTHRDVMLLRVVVNY